MNASSITQITGASPLRNRFNPIKNLRPETLSQALDAFETGRLSNAVRIFEAMLKRDDILCGLNLKRKKSVSRLESEISLLEDSARAEKHREVLQNFYANIEVKSLTDRNQRGGLRLLISQMMDAVAFKYSAHKVQFKQKNGCVSADFEHYPLWLFENTNGKLRLLESETQSFTGKELDDNQWLMTCADGLMFASSIAYLFKQLPLKDWLVYCERNAMPGIKAKTDAFPNSPEWDAACEAVRNFGSEFHAVMSEGTDIEAIDVSTTGELPYPKLVERIDRMLSALWRGSDLTTLSGTNKVGASVQWYEETLIEEDDAENISDTLNRQIDTQVIKMALGDEIPLAKFRLKLPDYEPHKFELEIIERLTALGLKPDPIQLARKFAYPILKKENDNA